MLLLVIVTSKFEPAPLVGPPSLTVIPPPKMLLAHRPLPVVGGDEIVALLIVTSLSVVVGSELCWTASPTLSARVIGPCTFRFWFPLLVPSTKMPSPIPPVAPE